MGPFLQIVEFTTTRVDEMTALFDEFREERYRMVDVHPLAVTTWKSRGDNRYAIIAEFASYEEAMANLALPETRRFAAALSELCDEPPTFLNLDLLRAYAPRG